MKPCTLKKIFFFHQNRINLNFILKMKAYERIFVNICERI